MPVYNCEKYLVEAIDSILQQTFTDFELLIVDGGSKDNSHKIIEQYQDSRIRLIFQDKNTKGLASALNQGLENARGKYVARMDCDDISYPQRLQKQVDFMDRNTNVGLCGTWIIYSIDGKLGKVQKYPTNFDEIKVSLFFSTSFGHPSVMIEKSLFKKHNLFYSTEFKYGEDYDLWNRCSEFFELANIPEVQVIYRVLSTSLFSEMVKKFPNQLREIYKRNLKSLKIEIDEENYQIHKILIRPYYLKKRELFEKVDLWIQELYEANLKEKKYPVKLFAKYLANNWFKVCFYSFRLGFWTWKKFWRSPISNYNSISLYLKLRFLASAIIFTFIPKRRREI